MSKESYYTSILEESEDLIYCWQLSLFTVPERAYVSFEYYDAKCIQCDSSNYCMLLKERADGRGN